MKIKHARAFGLGMAPGAPAFPADAGDASCKSPAQSGRRERTDSTAWRNPAARPLFVSAFANRSYGNPKRNGKCV